MDGAPFMVTAEPVAAVQVESGRSVDVFGREGGATAAVEQHQGSLAFLGVGALHFIQKLLRFAGLVIVLHAEQSKALVALGPELGDIAAAERVAIHEDRPALVRSEVGYEKASEGEIRALRRVSLAQD